MISIKEIRPPRKCSGLSSILVYFPRNEELTKIIKSMETFYYHKKDDSYELPIISLAKILDLMTFYDDIQLNLLDTNKNANLASLNTHSKDLTEDEINSFKVKPFEHQIAGINYGLNSESGKWLLLDEMGAGKTNEIIWYAETLKRRGLIEHCLIICGVNALKQNWKKEIQKFSTESAVILGEKITKFGTSMYMSVADRAKQLLNPIEEFFVITNIETFRNDKVVEAFAKSKNNFGLIAVDEIHRIANKSSTQGGNLLKLKAPYKVAATGTLLVNSPMSCYVPLFWTENDHSTLTMYKSQYCVMGGFNNQQFVDYKNLEVLQEEIQSCSIRRTKEEIAPYLPPKTVTTEIIELTEEHRKFYKLLVDSIKQDMQAPDFDRELKQAQAFHEASKIADKVVLHDTLLGIITRLRQATVLPSILSSKTEMQSSSKIDRCVELVEDLVSQNEKVVVLSTFKEPIYVLEKLLLKYKPLVCTGDVSDYEVSNNVTEFQTNPDCKIFLGTFGKCSTGITLNAASYLIALDETWTASQNNQAWDRIHRINNTKPAFIKVLMCKDTIDEKVHSIANYKEDLSDYIVDGEENHIATDPAKELLNYLYGL